MNTCERAGAASLGRGPQPNCLKCANVTLGKATEPSLVEVPPQRLHVTSEVDD